MKEKDSKDLMIKLANRMLISNKFPLKQDFEERIRENFNTTIDLVDFESNSVNLTKEINNWVSDQTNGNIYRLFDDSFGSETVLVLANAVYFHGKWKYAFDPKNTVKEDFYSIGDSNIGLMIPSKVDFMQIKGKFRLEFVPDLSAILLELPFSGDSDISMTIVSENLSFISSCTQ
jgi:serpin B